MPRKRKTKNTTYRSSKGASSVNKSMVSISTSRRVSIEKHKDLLTWVFDRISPSLYERYCRNEKYDRILEGLAAKCDVEGFDKQRQKQYATGQSNIVSELRYPKVLGNINDIVANVMNLLFPARQMYGSVELSPEKQNTTAVIVNEMNKNGRKLKHYTNMLRCVTDAIAFNIGIVENEYIEVRGFTNKTTRRRSDLSKTNNSKVIHKGTKLRHLDIFNTIIDYSVDPENYSTDAEFYGKVERLTDFDLIRMHDRREILLAPDAIEILRKVKMVNGVVELDNDNLPFYNTTNHFVSGSSGKSGFGGLYHDRCDFRSENHRIKEHDPHEEACKPFDLLKSMYDGDYTSYEERPTAKNELLTVTIRAREKDIGLDSELGVNKDDTDETDTMKIWRIGILNGVRIVSVKEVGTNHGMLPASITVPKTELSKLNSLSVSELLLPFQEADSSLLNIFIKQARSDKNKGQTYYDKSFVDMDDMLDPSSGRIGVDVAGASQQTKQPKRIQDLIHNVQGHPINNSLLQASKLLTQKTQDIFPTQSVDNLANLNRPVAHQSRQLTQMQNLPIYIFARTIHDELIEPQNYMHTMDIVNYSDTLRVINAEGEEEAIDPNQLDLESLDLAVSDGMRGIDTISVIDRLDKILQYAFQSPEVLREYDVMAIADYLLKMEGANIEMDAFKHKDALSALPPEERQLALQLLQQYMQEQQAQGGSSQPTQQQ